MPAVFQIRLISPPDAHPDELALISALFECAEAFCDSRKSVAELGALDYGLRTTDYGIRTRDAGLGIRDENNRGNVFYHLRKPDWALSRLAAFLDAIPARFHPRIVLHTHHGLADTYAVGGLHFGKSATGNKVAQTFLSVPGDYEILRTDKNVCATLPGNSHAIAVSGIKTSRPVHTLPELRDALDEGTWDALLVSPVFPSISKPGHAPLPSQFPASELRQLLSTNPRQTAVIALGGVTPDKLPALRELGFDGAAALGFVWNSPTPLAALRQLLHAT